MHQRIALGEDFLTLDNRRGPFGDDCSVAVIRIPALPEYVEETPINSSLTHSEQ
jgi:hypothetical protein